MPSSLHGGEGGESVCVPPPPLRQPHTAVTRVLPRPIPFPFPWCMTNRILDPGSPPPTPAIIQPPPLHPSIPSHSGRPHGRYRRTCREVKKGGGRGFLAGNKPPPSLLFLRYGPKEEKEKGGDPLRNDGRSWASSKGSGGGRRGKGERHTDGQKERKGLDEKHHPGDNSEAKTVSSQHLLQGAARQRQRERNVRQLHVLIMPRSLKHSRLKRKGLSFFPGYYYFGGSLLP